MTITRAIIWALAIAFSWGCGRASTEPETESVWDCWHVSTDLEILRDSKAAVLTLDLETGAATVQTSGQTWEARYSVEGLFRRWEYGGGRYAVALSDLGNANHYDYRALGGGWIHQHTLHCERRE